MVMNYIVDFTYTGSAPAADFSNCFIAQSSIYGATGDYDYGNVTDGPNRILQDFYEMKNQGFNTVRLVMTAKKRIGQGFYLEVKKFPTGQDYFYPLIDPPYDNFNVGLQFYKNSLLQVTRLASTAGLKLIEICGDQGKPSLNGDELISGTVGGVGISDYRNFMGSLASFVNSQSLYNFLAYEIQGEPTYREGFVSPHHLKSEMCDIINEWRGILKQNDPTHLITLGSFYLEDVFSEGWDPNFMNVDFMNLHLYLKPEEYEFDADRTTFLQKEYQRYLDKYYVYSMCAKKPFIIGETSFPGEAPHGNQYIAYPYSTFGDEADQKNFVEQTFPILKNFRSSGYAWWDFQNKHWYPTPGPTNPNPLEALQENYLGLLKYGDPDPLDMANGYENSNANLRKQAATQFVYYKNNPPTFPTTVNFGPQSSTANISEPFYNPYLHPVNNLVFIHPLTSFKYYGTLTGYVKDQNGRPIKNAVLKGTSIVGSNGALKKYHSYHTYTDESGYFVISGFDSDLNSDGDINYPVLDNLIVDLKFGAYESKSVEQGWNGASFVDGSTITLHSLQSKFDSEIDNEVIPIGTTEDFTSYSMLTAKQLIVQGNGSAGGSSELKATDEVNLKSGFRAEFGSEVHIFTEKIEVNCADISDLGFRRANPVANTDELNIGSLEEKEIEINFFKKGYEINAAIFPNPNNGNFKVQLNGAVNENTSSSIKIIDCIGNTLYQDKFQGAQSDINTKNLHSGVYFILISSSNFKSFLKFIVL